MSFQLTKADPMYGKYIASVCRSGADVSSIWSAWQTLFVDYFLEGDNPGCTAYLLFDGIDEAFEEDRTTFFKLLRDVEEAGSASRLHIAMLGRPQIIDEISDELDKEVPTIHVDWTKNGSDITHYIESSISKSRVLSKVSKKLKAEVVQSLGSKANGMFMWVRLMIMELSKKSREPAIREALNKAPRGLTEMLRHVLAGFSSTIKDEEEAGDLNDMLMWVTLAKRPLSLGEIDAMLRLKSEEGDGVLNLESKLRKQFATFFVLTRDDTLTTADLQAPTKILDVDDEEAEDDGELDDGVDDVDHDDFNSNPTNTTVAFAHASIGDYFRDEKEGKVTAPGEDHTTVGVDLHEAQLKILQICLDILTSDDIATRMKDANSLMWYTRHNWNAHFDEVNKSKVPVADKIKVASALARMLHDKPLLPNWAGGKGYNFWTADTAKGLLSWLTDPDVFDQLPDEAKVWITSVEANPVELWEPAMKFVAERWFHVGGGEEFTVLPCLTMIHAYTVRKAGGVFEKEPKWTNELVESTARWAELEESAEWHRKLGLTYRGVKLYEQAVVHCEKAVELDPGLWRAVVGLSKVYNFQKEYTKSAEAGLKALELAEADPDQTHKFLKAWKGDIHRAVADAYEALAEAIEDDGDMVERCRLNELCCEHFKKSYMLYMGGDPDSMWAALQVLSGFIEPPWKGKEEDEAWKGRTLPELSPPIEYHKRIMQTLHEMDETTVDDDHTLFDKYLSKSMWSDENFEISAKAAVATSELEWLQERYKRGMAVATKDLCPVTAAYLGLCLAELLSAYGEDEDKAIRMWEKIGSEGSASTRVATDISYARTLALQSLGRSCIRRALADEANAAPWITKMERIASRRRYGTGAGVGIQDAVPPNGIALYLASWYRRQERAEEARELVRPHVRDGIVILSDDDPNNDEEGWYSLATAFFAIGDDENAIAILQSLRMYDDDDVAVFDDDDDDDEKKKEKEGEDAEAEAGAEKHDSGAESETQSNTDDDSGTESDSDTDDEKSDSAAKGAVEEPKDDDDDDDDEFVAGYCDGSCSRSFVSWDGTFACRFCLNSLCEDCYGAILKGEMTLKICGANHDFLKIPVLKTRIKSSELLVGEKVVSVEEWKAGIKKQWSLV